MYQEDNEKEAWVACLKNRDSQSDKSWGVAFILSISLGFFGADRFYLESGCLGLLKLISLGGLGLWWAIDILLIFLGVAKDNHGRKIRPPWQKN